PSPACTSRSSGPRWSRCAASGWTATSSRSKPTRSSRGSSSTRSTIWTACCCSTVSIRTSASARCGRSASRTSRRSRGAPVPRSDRGAPAVRLVFLGTPADAVTPLRALVDAGHDVALVLTQPDRRRTRGGHDDPSPVKRAASDLGLPVLTPTRAREVIEDVAASGALIGVAVAFGQLLPPAFLGALRHGFVNLHYSLLPPCRGAAPGHRAIRAGDLETGVCFMRIDEGLDTGGVYACASTAIGSKETAGELHARLTDLGTRLLVEHLPRVLETKPIPQHGEATYAE